MALPLRLRLRLRSVERNLKAGSPGPRLMSSRPLGVALVVVAAIALAGCAEPPLSITTLRATATNGFYMSPLVYTGDATPFQGDALVDVDAVANTGTVTFTARAGNDTYEGRFTSFAAAPDKPFQDGGIAALFHEHGATGVGDASIPEVNLLVAGWGPVALTKNGQPLKDPVTGMDAWAGHFMLTDTGVFAADRSVKNTAGGVYDPGQAANGAVEAGDLELHVSLKNNAGAAQNLTPIDVTIPVQGGQVAADTPVEVPQAASADITLFVETGAPPTPPLAQLTLSLKDPSGTEVATLAAGQPGQPQATTLTLTDPPAGTWTLTASGTGANAAYGVRMALTAATSANLYFVFETVTIESGLPVAE